MLHRLTLMLSECMEDPAIKFSGTATQFAAIRVAVVVVWHFFPCMWVLGATNTISPFAEHAGYVVCDLSAKYLLLFVYLSHVNG